MENKTFAKVPKSQYILWLVCRSLLLIWGTVALFQGATVQFLQAVFGIAFTHLWDMFQLWGGNTFIKKVPCSFQSLITVFICFGCLVGTTVNVFTDFQHIDLLTHLISGIVASAIGFKFTFITQGENRKTGVALASMFSLCAAVTVAVGWEFYEFSMDRLYGLTLQMSSPLSESGLIDTMVDFIMCAAGAIIGMIYCALYHTGKIGKNRKIRREEYLKNK